MADFVREQEIDWPVAADLSGETVAAFGVDSYPDYYLIDRGGRLRVADLANADLERAVQALLGELTPISIEPPASPDGGEMPYVSSVLAASPARAGSPARVEVRGSYPSAGWTFAGFQLEREGEGGRTLVLTPRAHPPEGPAAQVLQPFAETAELLILEPGAYPLQARGRGQGEISSPVLEVLPADTLLRLRIQGGILGFDEQLDLRASGMADFRSNRRGGPREIQVPPDVLARIVERIEGLPAGLESPPPTSAAADLLAYELTLWREGARTQVRVDDLNAGLLVPLLELLRAIP